jgi:hypothetical protein
VRPINSSAVSRLCSAPKTIQDYGKNVLTLLLREFSFYYPAVNKKTECFLHSGACSHWARPHQTRWTVAGGFAWPSGYLSRKGHSLNGLPELDWSVLFRLTDGRWRPVANFQGQQKVVLRAAVPSRTTRHKQAAVDTLWLPSNRTVFYGFRKLDGAWTCVANSDDPTGRP